MALKILVYLRTDPAVVHNRILQRARKEEKTVPLSYIEALHKIHEDWYVKKKKKKKFIRHCLTLIFRKASRQNFTSRSRTSFGDRRKCQLDRNAKTNC